jgi:cellulose synthase/poly-beta-1,6-N-acetylglucosamine synthase-like glycosyltransferase
VEPVILGVVDFVLLVCLLFLFAIAGFYLYLLYWLAELPAAEEVPAKLSADLPADLPAVLVQIPVFNELSVVERALDSAAALDWPRDRLAIQLLDDSTDLTSDVARHAVARLRARGIDVEHVQRTTRAGFKAGALAEGMARHGAPFVAVFDADFVAPPDWLKRAIAPMLADPKVAFVQTRIEWGNGGANWLTRAQRLMQDAHFAVEQHIRYRRGLPFQFNGTGGIWRREAVEMAGGWSHDTLSEDLDLVLRTHLNGWHGVFLMEPHVVGELPQRIEAFRAQQGRWSKGFVQVARKLFPSIWTSDWSVEAKIVTTLQLMLQGVFPVMALGIVALVLSTVGHGYLIGPARALLWLWLLVILVILFGMTWGAYRRMKRGDVARYLVTAASVPALVIYLAFSNAAAIVGAGFGKKSEFNRTPKTGV